MEQEVKSDKERSDKESALMQKGVAKPDVAAGRGKIAVIRLKGLTGIKKPVKDTLLMLNLHKRHYCVIIDDNPVSKGMIRKVKDLITWGPIAEDTLKILVEKRGEKDKDGKMKPYFRLHPPRKGLERKGIKKTYNVGGALGPRGEKINDLIRRMI